MTNNLKRLATAMAQMEGWNPAKGGGSDGSLPSLAYRNHNPGNLRSSPFMAGQRDGFAFFYDDNVGWFALVWDLWKKAKGETSTGLTGDSTLHDLINVYAPPAENPTDTYIANVEKWTGFSRTMKLKELLTN